MNVSIYGCRSFRKNKRADGLPEAPQNKVLSFVPLSKKDIIWGINRVFLILAQWETVLWSPKGY